MTTKKRLLQSYLNRESKHRDIYHDMMPFKVREILLISNMYDSFLMEREGKFSEIMLYDYGQMNLTSLPRITGVSFREEAFEQLESKKIDMVIVMVGINRTKPMRISKKIKEQYPDLPVFILLNNNTHISYFQQRQSKLTFDQMFVWNGESRVFFAMIKYLEDLKNAKTDTELAAVRQILIVEDSPVYYSAYLAHLYQIIFRQTDQIVNEVSTDKLYKVLKLRARPKILLATNYEDGIRLFNEYKDFLFCLISDVEFQKNKHMHKNAGFELIEEVRSIKKDLPVVVISSDNTKVELANEIGITFIDKRAQNLYKDLKHSVTQKIGFGKFLFKDRSEKVVATAKTIKDFEHCLKTVPDESLLFHAEADHFSLWLMARTEIQLANILVKRKVHEFTSASAIRSYLLDTIQEYRDERPKGRVVPFDESACNSEENILTLSDGAYGGKGRGLAFMSSLKAQFDIEKSVKGIKIRIPKTALIGAEEFEDFLDRNDYAWFKENPPGYDEAKDLFLKGRLSQQLMERLDLLLNYYKKPIAVRSSGLFEDSISQPFAGIFETYILPNNHKDKWERLKQLTDAIKLVFASVFSDKAINYTKALNQKLGEEKMAIVIQELVGNEFNGVYYPHISGVAQSYNYYPFAHMKPEEGFAVAAVGLGMYVVEGEVAYRFSPKYPKTQFLSLEDQVKHTQTYFYAVDLEKQNINLLEEGVMTSLKKIPVYKAKDHGSLAHCVSVFDYNNNSIYPGLNRKGPIVVDFANILKYRYIPLAKTINTILTLMKNSFDSPVEIEFAVDLEKDEKGKASFYILQVKPIIRAVESFRFNINTLPKEDIILYAEKGMGNGVIDHIKDVIYVKDGEFDTTLTEEMAQEVDRLNEMLGKEEKEYILIGPGRWGTRDRFIGIPVNWPQVCNAKVIVETSLEDFPLDASHGSHFFHNLTSLNVAYFSVDDSDTNSFINYELLESADLVQETEFFKHVRFKQPVEVKIDGKRRVAVISRKSKKRQKT